MDARMLKIGPLEFDFPVILAPLSAVSDMPFRLLSREFGCPFAFTEMISFRALLHDNRIAQLRMKVMEEDRPLGLQILGDDPGDLEEGMGRLKNLEHDLLDFNAACPANKVVHKGEGARFLQDPERLHDRLAFLRRLTGKPLTVKIRSGWDGDTVNAVEVALAAQEAGVDAVFIHGRTRKQFYAGTVDYGIIGAVKQAVRVPVIASGDAFTPALIKKMFDETGCDGVGVARGAIGNPWIFSEARQYLATGTTPERPDTAEVARVMRRHLDLCIDGYGEKLAPRIFRKFVYWYTKGLPHVKPLRVAALKSSQVGEILALIAALPEKNVRLPERQANQIIGR
jgi:tRNA-dihydrouridine synthase B